MKVVRGNTRRLKRGSAEWKAARAEALKGFEECLRTVASLQAKGGTVVHSADPESHGSQKRVSQDGL
jgi:hypothetical protein